MQNYSCYNRKRLSNQVLDLECRIHPLHHSMLVLWEIWLSISCYHSKANDNEYLDSIESEITFCKVINGWSRATHRKIFPLLYCFGTQIKRQAHTLDALFEFAQFTNFSVLITKACSMRLFGWHLLTQGFRIFRKYIHAYLFGWKNMGNPT